MATRLLEVLLYSKERTRWKWSVMDMGLLRLGGYETSRETAQIAGDSTVFELLCKPDGE